MSTPQMPNIPGAAVMTDTLDFVKSLWGSMGVPGLASPTLSLDELDKKISDLKAVESWLNLNQAMLRSSIQALEVQRGTIATLKSMGQSLADSMQQKPGRTEKSLFEANPYAAAFFNHLEPAKVAPKPPAPTPTPVPKPEVKAEAKPAQKVEAKPADEALPKPDLAAAAAAQMANPAIWWNMLQEQFKQAVSTAMTAETRPAPAPEARQEGAANEGAKADGEADPKADGTAARKPAARKTTPKKE
ncbi:PhaM family polyhydroxyalkanoate granule multifunctional regulatory protein [Massilia sp. METH4]|uniref:PhaM family polyhydroxyalkanoate granule multifunctional regulatory protein n=1 Tax=Massilia sp. METH4 TaxID=3123041 RepID=UPI0030D2F7DD